MHFADYCETCILSSYETEKQILGYSMGGNTGGVVGNVLGKALGAKGGAPSLGGLGGIIGGFNPGAATSLNPGSARLAIANLAPGGLMPGVMQNSMMGGKTVNPQVNIGGGRVTNGNNSDDWRVTVGLTSGFDLFYQNQGTDCGYLDPLKQTAGVMFPYTPALTTQFTTGYNQQKTTHSNYPAYFYESSEVAALSITGEFTVQNDWEANYLLACVYFFRTVSKMFYGSSSNAGNPPPLLMLSGYGRAYLPDVPCVLTSFSHTMPAEVDYYAFKLPDRNGVPEEEMWWERAPTSSQIQITLQPIYSRRQTAGFNLEEFSAGRLLGFI